MPQHVLTPLLFGDDSCTTHRDAGALGASVMSLCPHLRDCDVRSGHAFMGKTASVQLPGMSFLAAAVTSLRMDVADHVHSSIAFPVHGHARLRLDGQAFRWGPASGCLFVPAGSGPKKAHYRAHNMLMLQIDQQALELAARAVLGLERDHPVDLGCDRAAILTARAGPSLTMLARQIGATIDLYALNPQLLHRLGFQDFVYRQLVLLFRPDWQAQPPGRDSLAGSRKRRAIDRACDAMLADLPGRFTLSELAELSCMSVRALQYGFRSRFDKSPMQWLRDERLEHARRSLLGGTQDSMAQLAGDCGFATASAFSAFYRRRYGEAPTTTRAKRF